MNDQPLISVIIPAYNATSTINEALLSMTNQTYPNLEIIVVDDHSTDNTALIVKEFQKTHPNVVYVYNDQDDVGRVNKKGRNVNAGWNARNIGFSHAHGEWITFQDADDMSFLNRIEVQYELAQKHNALHIATQWVSYHKEYADKILDLDAFLKDHSDITTYPEQVVALAKKNRGVAFLLLGNLHQFIPFKIKTARVINKLFFGALDPYPGTSLFLVHRSVMEKIRFEPRDKRIWPSFVGRGADRDFGFRVAIIFKKSYCFNIPLHIWRIGSENPLFPPAEIKKYLRKKPWI